jgi:hypothetical protein
MRRSLSWMSLIPLARKNTGKRNWQLWWLQTLVPFNSYPRFLPLVTLSSTWSCSWVCCGNWEKLKRVGKRTFLPDRHLQQRSLDKDDAGHKTNKQKKALVFSTTPTLFLPCLSVCLSVGCPFWSSVGVVITVCLFGADIFFEMGSLVRCWDYARDFYVLVCCRLCLHFQTHWRQKREGKKLRLSMSLAIVTKRLQPFIIQLLI